MNIRRLSMVLIAGGLLFLLFGVFMDTSVETTLGDVVNISLVARQQMFMTLGGITLIAGILLFGIWKLKQTPHDEVREAEEKRGEAEERRRAMEATERRVHEAADGAKARVDGILARVTSRLDDQAPLRLTSGAATGLWFGLLTGYLFSSVTIGIAVFTACMLYAVWMADARRGQVRLFRASLITAAIATVIQAILVASIVGPMEVTLNASNWLYVIFDASELGTALMFLVAWFFAHRWAVRDANYVSAKDVAN